MIKIFEELMSSNKYLVNDINILLNIVIFNIYKYYFVMAQIFFTQINNFIIRIYNYNIIYRYCFLTTKYF